MPNGIVFKHVPMPSIGACPALYLPRALYGVRGVAGYIYISFNEYLIPNNQAEPRYSLKNKSPSANNENLSYI